MAQRDALTKAILLVRRGDKAGGRQILQKLIEQNELKSSKDLELAWLWMADCMDSPDEKRTCFEQVLDINPSSVVARREMTRLGFSVRLSGRAAREAAQRAERFKRLTSGVGPASPAQFEQAVPFGRPERSAAAAPVLPATPQQAARLDQVLQNEPAGEDEAGAEASLSGGAAEPDWLELTTPSPDSPAISTIPDAPILPKHERKRKRKPAPEPEKEAKAKAPLAPVVAQALPRPALPSWALPALLGLVLFAAIFWLMMFFASPGSPSLLRLGAPPDPRASEYQVEYVISGTAAQVKVTYADAANKMQTFNLSRLPFTRPVTMPLENTPRMLVTVENLTERGSIDCEIKVNGVSRTTNTTSAPKGFITCNALPQ